uniref:Cytohesin 4b n=1 Tax=Amphilophus citrinellus TaxID=61819 RepID=A0A3Q0SNQ4_AMPCI
MTDCQMVSSDFTAQEKMEIESIKTYKKDLLDDIQKLKMEIDNVMAQILSFESAEENKTVEKNKQFSNGKKKFNMDPKKGINYLVENKLLNGSAQSIAEFLYKEEGLNKTAIGEFLGERDELHLQTLKAFVELHEFSDLNLVQALRSFLWSFRLPGEAQKIDRMMEAFATRYCDCNHNVFQSTDTCYILSFAIIMLNTSLHNPNVKDKTTLERFISMNRGINNGENLPDDLLSVRTSPNKKKNKKITVPTQTPRGGRVKTWKRRWFILTDNCLYYFEYTTDKEPRGIIPLENLCVREVPYSRKPYCLELYNPNSRGQKIKACKTETDGRVVEGKHQSYTICASSADERDSWIEAIRASITKDPFYDLVSLRKKKVIHQTPQDSAQQEPTS